MPRIARLSLFFALLSVLSGCHKTPLYAPPSALGEVLVRIYDAEVDEERVWVKMHVHNQSDQAIEMDRDAIGLRLPSGQVVPRASGITTQHTPYVIEAGQQRKVHVDFRAPHDLDDADGLFLVVGGVRLGDAGEPRTIGEIPLVRDYTTIAAPPPVQGPPIAEVEPATAPTASRGDAPEPAPASVTPAPAVAERPTVAVDLSRLDREAFDELDGVELEKQLVVRLVQDGFAVVAASEAPTRVVYVTRDGDGVLLRLEEDGRTETREVPDRGQDRDALHHELAQKAAALLHASPPVPDQPPLR